MTRRWGLARRRYSLFHFRSASISGEPLRKMPESDARLKASRYTVLK
jgi:hypothetical protein